MIVVMALSWLLTAVLAVSVLVVATARIPVRLIILSALLDRYGLYLIPLGLLALVLAGWAYAGGARITGSLAALVACAAVVAGVVLLASALRAARRAGARLSLRRYVAGGRNEGRPVQERSVEYREGLPLDVKLPAGPAAGPYPAVIWVHGGGWNEGDRGEAPLWHRWLNERGYAVFAIEYRLAPPPRWDQAPEDVRAAVAWVRAHAAEYGVDPGRVMLAGGSAGGNLALLAAYTTPDVRAVAAFYPPTDIAEAWRDTGFPPVRVMAENYTGGTPVEVPDRYRAASPVTHVRPGLPPTLLMHGDRDHVAPYAGSPRLARLLGEAGVPHRLVRLPFAEHVFDFSWGAWSTQICRHVFAEFLDEHSPPHAGPAGH
ncbi:alpha/beta hydrolase [Longispora fulva]|uniref:Acetyl esterase/lipase n=1 Tax=Longispora fulva TaxID=619741 RepID=A0A8J7KNS1_9ACTN|nr:alpha/beta hydrolase [Longispora fulva]MBG6135522.1 acetyl esterase/lipase [Longispora fulva]